jgi:hypothetical protein
MRVFNCDHCGHLVFFDSVQCLHCGSVLAFLPDALTIAALEPAAEHLHPGPKVAHATPATALWQRKGWQGNATQTVHAYRLCHNRTAHQACNFAVRADDPHALCTSCRQTRVLPDLSAPANLGRWKQIEAAKRHLFYTLSRLGLEPIAGQRSPVFEFLADLPGYAPIITGHANGVITLNIAEADDAVRAERRIALGEPYRTLLGHLRHESGHFYWDLLARNPQTLDAFRAVFGDERSHYAQALEQYYAQNGSHDHWFDQHVSAYASAHPWEDWAETWAHYLHMVDLLETAASYRTTVTVPGPQSHLQPGQVQDPFASATTLPFDTMVAQWVPLTLMLNSLNRSLGQQDAYPFALSVGAIAKLRFVHDWVQSVGRPEPAPNALLKPLV